ncbi:hypothetical protein [Streptomyces platensis]|uniref:hypothetical protein n=1 Tax=Streptomyces platensis TaxID=58346 RepID=UPI001F1C8600|nr:hypothetical protein [Streptomyces platensis]MCF3145190.1 hypothetical protein [Streptomyces platensis]
MDVRFLGGRPSAGVVEQITGAGDSVLAERLPDERPTDGGAAASFAMSSSLS